jgi:hypothetical protein
MFILTHKHNKHHQNKQQHQSRTSSIRTQALNLPPASNSGHNNAHTPLQASSPQYASPPSTRPLPTKKHQHEPQTPGNATGYPRHHGRTTDARSGNKTARNEAPTEAVGAALVPAKRVTGIFFVVGVISCWKWDGKSANEAEEHRALFCSLRWAQKWRNQRAHTHLQFGPKTVGTACRSQLHLHARKRLQPSKNDAGTSKGVRLKHI